MAETSKALPRLKANGFYARHIEGKKVIDVGVGRLDFLDKVKKEIETVVTKKL